MSMSINRGTPHPGIKEYRNQSYDVYTPYPGKNLSFKHER